MNRTNTGVLRCAQNDKLFCKGNQALWIAGVPTSPAQAAYEDDQGGTGGEAGELEEDAGEAGFTFELGQEVHRCDVEEAAGADGQEPGDGGGRVGAGEEDCSEAEEGWEAGVEGEAEGSGERDLEVDEEGEVAHAVGDLVEGDGEGGEPADARGGEEGYGYGGSIDEAVEHGGEDEGGGAGSLGGVLVMVLGAGRADLGLGVGAGDDEEDALGGEEGDHGGAGEGPGETAVAELLDGLGEEMQEGRREEDADGERDDVGELAAEGGLAGTEEPGRGGRGELDGGGGEDGGDDRDGGDNCSLKCYVLPDGPPARGAVTS